MISYFLQQTFLQYGGRGFKIGNKQQLRVPNIACIIRFGMLCQPCSSNMDNSISVATFCQFKRSGESCMFKKPSSVTKLIQLGLKVCCFTHVAQHVELKGQTVLYTVTASMSANYTKKVLRQNTLFTQIYDENIS